MAEKGSDQQLRVLTLNCWGIPYISKQVKERFHHIAKELATGKYDVVFLQEVWSKDDYHNLCSKLADILPHSLYFYSGVIGSGVCVFSKYPIIDSFTYRYTLNGYFYKILHGDWFGGKSACYCLIDHPKKPIHFFTSHLHAEYNRKNDEYLAHRVVQAYQLAEFIQKLTRLSDCVIVCGDMNSEPTDLCYRVITSLPGLTDTWLQCRMVGNHGNTCDVSHNSYTDLTLPKKLQGGPVDGKRIDYIYYRVDPATMTCVDCQVTMGRIPGKDFSYSDHEGVLATFAFRQSSQDSATEEREPKADAMASSQAVLKEVASMMNHKIASVPYRKRSMYAIVIFAVFILMPLFYSDDSLSLYGMGTSLGRFLYIIRILCTIVVTALLYYVLFNDRDEFYAYKDIQEAVNIEMKQMSLRRRVTGNSG